MCWIFGFDESGGAGELSWWMLEEYADPKKLPMKPTSTMNDCVSDMHNHGVNPIFLASFQTLEMNSWLLLAPYEDIVAHQRV